MKKSAYTPLFNAVRLLPLNATYRTYVRVMFVIQRARTVDVARLADITGYSAAKIGTLLATFESYGWIRNNRIVPGWFNTLFANAATATGRNVRSITGARARIAA